MSPRAFRSLAAVAVAAGLVLSLTSRRSRSARRAPATSGVPFDGTPGPLNAITDVAGVEVGHATLISGDGTLVVGKGPVRTGVTADPAARQRHRWPSRCSPAGSR